jgi:hypothetical protein
MSRAIIGGVVAVLIAAVTAIAYFVTTSSLEDQVAKEARTRVDRAQSLLVQSARLEGLGILKRVEVLAADADYVKALGAATPGQKGDIANFAFRRFMQGESGAKPDLVVLTDHTGDIVAMLDVLHPVGTEWKKDGEIIYPAVKLALEKRIITSDVWNYQGKGLMKVGVAPIVDHDANPTDSASDADQGVVVGCLIIGYSMTAAQAQEQGAQLGTAVAYFRGDKIYATSFRREGSAEDTAMQEKLAPVLATQSLGKLALEKGLAGIIVQVQVQGDTYVATAGRLQPFSSKPLPPDYPASQTGAMVLMSLEESAAFGKVKMFILLLGGVSLVLALLAMHLAARKILHEVDQISVGVAEIINGNIDYSFRPVGDECDGLANGLNVMLARLLGRPEPGDEEFDEEGNPVQRGKVDFDDKDVSPADSAALALANEPEPEYYTRIFNEYVKAREENGESAKDLAYDSFIAKLRVNEGKLKAQYQSKAVRFRVVVKDGKVTLKPVPIV